MSFLDCDSHVHARLYSSVTTSTYLYTWVWSISYWYLVHLRFKRMCLKARAYGRPCVYAKSTSALTTCSSAYFKSRSIAVCYDQWWVSWDKQPIKVCSCPLIRDQSVYQWYSCTHRFEPLLAATILTAICSPLIQFYRAPYNCLRDWLVIWSLAILKPEVHIRLVQYGIYSNSQKNSDVYILFHLVKMASYHIDWWTVVNNNESDSFKCEVLISWCRKPGLCLHTIKSG